jgi:hypothetical protein
LLHGCLPLLFPIHIIMVHQPHIGKLIINLLVVLRLCHTSMFHKRQEMLRRTLIFFMQVVLHSWHCILSTIFLVVFACRSEEAQVQHRSHAACVGLQLQQRQPLRRDMRLPKL